MENFKYLHQFFEFQADNNPENIALNFNDSTLTYRELEQRSNQLAHALKANGVGPGQLVALLLPPSVNIYVSILAILKAGGGYVPLTPTYPAERINYILQDCKVNTLITLSSYEVNLQNLPSQILCLDQAQDEIKNHSKMRIADNEIKLSPDDLCYIIYTSGTTGRPKGVEITHRGICNFVEVIRPIYGITSRDRVYQGFSITFDASVEEIWITFAAGATLIPTLSEAIRAGAGLINFLNAQNVTVFSCVPTLLAMLDGDIPTLRLLILGGEVCPHDLIVRWSQPKLRIINTYGPTEASVMATYTECQPDKPVTLGRPLPNYEIQILKENLEPAPVGEIGELCIGGVSLARGYVNQPELVQQKFIYYPKQSSKRFYRTGDLVRLMETGEIHFVGRVDEQIKLRGFRIELPEIETVLMQYPNVRYAVVHPQELHPGMPTLVAYLMLSNNTPLDAEALRGWLRLRLPAYMVPNIFELMETFPTLASGKIDRQLLPRPKMQSNFQEQNHTAPNTDLEKTITHIWEEMFHRQPISITANFFDDLGGHSLYVAKAVSELRKQPHLESLSMLDIYENPTIEQLAKKIEKITKSYHEKKFTPVAKTSTLYHRLCGMAQAASLYLTYALGAWEFIFLYSMISYATTEFPMLSVPFFLTLFCSILIVPIALFAFVIAAKWILIGRFKAGTYPLWGTYYFRWWLVSRLMALVPNSYLVGSGLMNLYCRLMGAKIGKNCSIYTTHMIAFDLIRIDDNSSIGLEAYMQGYFVEDGQLKLGTIAIGKNCFIGNSCVLGINTVIEDNAKLDHMSMLPANQKIPANQSFKGSPARPASINLFKVPLQQQKNTTLKNLGFSLLQCVALLLIVIIYSLALVPGIFLIDHFYYQYGLIAALLTAPFAGVSFVITLCALVVLAKNIFLRKVKPGIYPIQSGFYLRKWLFDRLMTLTMSPGALYTFYGTTYVHLWLRLLGAKIGNRTEIATPEYIAPHLLTVEDESFIADTVILGAPRIYQGYVAIFPNKIGKRSFIGNAALIPGGTDLSDNCLIGCLSTTPDENIVKSNTSWVGSPAVFLPKREKFSTFTEQEVYRPTRFVYAMRLVIDFFRITLPSTFLFILLSCLFASYDKWGNSLLALALILPFITCTLSITFALAIVGIKWLCLGKLHTQEKPAASVFVWLDELINGLYEDVALVYMAEFLLGTPFFPFYLRLMGAKVGKKVFLDSPIFTEFDLVKIGNNVALNKDCTIQNHLFEDRVLKMSTIAIGDNCTVGTYSIILYDTVMEPNSSLDSLSLLMKGETLPTQSHWQGTPAQPIETT